MSTRIDEVRTGQDGARWEKKEEWWDIWCPGCKETFWERPETAAENKGVQCRCGRWLELPSPTVSGTGAQPRCPHPWD